MDFSPFTNLLIDKKLTYEAKGLGLFLFTRPNDFKISVDDLIKESPAGRTKVTRIVNELIEHGYLFRESLRNDRGQFSDGDYHLNKEKLKYKTTHKRWQP